MDFGEQPVNVNCNKCRATVTTVTDSETGSGGKIIACKYHLIKTEKTPFSCRAIFFRPLPLKKPLQIQNLEFPTFLNFQKQTDTRLIKILNLNPPGPRPPPKTQHQTLGSWLKTRLMIQDFFCELGIKSYPVVYITFFSRYHAIVRPIKIIKGADKNWAHFQSQKDLIWFLLLKIDFETWNFAIFAEVLNNFGRSWYSKKNDDCIY